MRVALADFFSGQSRSGSGSGSRASFFSFWGSAHFNGPRARPLPRPATGDRVCGQLIRIEHPFSGPGPGPCPAPFIFGFHLIFCPAATSKELFRIGKSGKQAEAATQAGQQPQMLAGRDSSDSFQSPKLGSRMGRDGVQEHRSDWRALADQLMAALSCLQAPKL